LLDLVYGKEKVNFNFCFTILEFSDFFVIPISQGQSTDATASEIRLMKRRSFLLSEEMKKFVHRKDQSILKKDLPSKHEYVVYIPLSPFQKLLYQQFLEQLNVLSEKPNILQLVSWLSKIETHPDLIKKIMQRKGVSKSSFSGSSSFQSSGGSAISQSIEINSDSDDQKSDLLDLEKIDINIPLEWAAPVFDQSYKERDVNHSAKMKTLFKIIDKCLESDEKILVFSQYTSTLDLMEELMATRKFNDKKLRNGVDYCRLDGSHTLTSREKNIKDFNSTHSKKKVFLISTRYSMSF
jgi:SNF2 family DNA or RNA helicase